MVVAVGYANPKQLRHGTDWIGFPLARMNGLACDQVALCKQAHTRSIPSIFCAESMSTTNDRCDGLGWMEWVRGSALTRAPSDDPGEVSDVAKCTNTLWPWRERANERTNEREWLRLWQSIISARLVTIESVVQNRVEGTMHVNRCHGLNGARLVCVCIIIFSTLGVPSLH